MLEGSDGYIGVGSGDRAVEHDVRIKPCQRIGIVAADVRIGETELVGPRPGCSLDQVDHPDDGDVIHLLDAGQPCATDAATSHHQGTYRLRHCLLLLWYDR